MHADVWLQEEGRGRGQEGQLPLQQSHVLPSSYRSRGAAPNQLPDSRWTRLMRVRTRVRKHHLYCMKVYWFLRLTQVLFSFSSLPCVSVPRLPPFVKLVGLSLLGFCSPYSSFPSLIFFLSFFLLSFLSFFLSFSFSFFLSYFLSVHQPLWQL